MKSEEVVLFLVTIIILGPASKVLGDKAMTGTGSIEPSPMSCSGSTPHDDDTNYYVDAASGDDSYPGTQSCPTQTIQQAVTNSGPDDTIIVSDGNYQETVALDSEGQIIKAATGSRVVIDGSESVNGDLGATWTQHSQLDSGWIWKANLPKDEAALLHEEEMPASGQTSLTLQLWMTMTIGPMEQYPERTSTTLTQMQTVTQT